MITTIGLVLVGSIPSPSFNSIDFWPRPITLYGLMIGLGVIAATLLARSRFAARRIHPDTAVEILMWVIPAGVVGARLYHVITDGRPVGEWIKIWEGGLGIPGAILGGVAGALVFIRRHDLPRTQVFDAVVPALPLAQAIGRWGNWWNQELYGRPTELPWGLEIDEPLAGYEGFDTFHPTFLYESLWNLGLCGLLLWIELLRIDPATEVLGLRVNLWMMGILLLLSLWMLRDVRRMPGLAIDLDRAPADDEATGTDETTGTDDSPWRDEVPDADDSEIALAETKGYEGDD